MDGGTTIVIILIVIALVFYGIWRALYGGGSGPATQTPTTTKTYVLTWTPVPPGEPASPKQKIQVNITITVSGGLGVPFPAKGESFKVKVAEGSDGEISSNIDDPENPGMRLGECTVETDSTGTLSVDIYGYEDGDDELQVFNKDGQNIGNKGYETLKEDPE
jgi:hypothetical protein